MSDLPVFLLIVAGFFGVGFALEYALQRSRLTPRIKVWLSSRVHMAFLKSDFAMIWMVRIIGWTLLVLAVAGAIVMAYNVVAGLSVHALLVVVVILVIVRVVQSQKNLS